MKGSFILFTIIGTFFYLALFNACLGKEKQDEKIIVATPEDLQKKSSGLIRKFNHGEYEDSLSLHQPAVVNFLYGKSAFLPLWYYKEIWRPQANSLLLFIENAKLYGLFPEDYHLNEINSIKTKFFADSLNVSDRKDAVLWSKADILLTDAFVQLLHDIKLGRLPQDSVTLRKDSVLENEFYFQQYDDFFHSKSLVQIIDNLEPKILGYRQLKKGIRNFLDSSDNRSFTLVTDPRKDSAKYKMTLQKRLFEGGFIKSDSIKLDSVKLAQAIKRFQLKKGLAADGKAGESTIRTLNMTDKEKFIHLAISLDQYKMLPQVMPNSYILVNIPSFQLKLIENDTVKLLSKIICGKPTTKTPLLTSAIAELITYPQWIIPTSIILKEILPGVKRNPGYITKKGFSLLDSKGQEVDPYTVNWSKYTKGIPYRVVQGSGDDNALGIFKFNFSNKYSVYLHDTNQRYLFGQSKRALSHGCVRVQEWEKLADYILINDTPIKTGISNPKIDSVKVWLQNKQKHNIPVKNKLPIYIRYITCEGKGESILFYEDIYGYDKILIDNYFAEKKIK